MNKNKATTTRFPFDCIIVTSPDEASAESAEVPLKRLLHDQLLHDYPEQDIRIISTFDSFGARCGSGGGTLAALECATNANDPRHSDGKDDDKAVVENILVLHAGGDSSRCPTQMILGKAWTSLSCSRYPNPITWLIHQIRQLFLIAHFPQGTVVVAATDTLLTFFEASLGDVEDLVGSESNTIHWNFDHQPHDTETLVLGIAVPAVVETATNHGVYVLSNETAKTKGLTVTYPLKVWQKPSVTQLTTTHFPDPAGGTAAACFEHDDGQQCAWIDTGVIVFLPKAVQVLNELSQGILSMCTRAGIQAAYDSTHGFKEKYKTVEEFAKQHARNVDLYTEIMHNLYWPSRMPLDQEEEANPLRATLSKVSLKILAAPEGRFLHLGTTKELVNFVTTEASSRGSDSNVTGGLSSQLSLRPRYQCWTEALPLNHNVAIHSTFPSDTVIGRASLVEYCDLDGYASVVVGSNCMVSGWRNPGSDSTAYDLPDDITVQMMALKQKGDFLTSEYVYMVLGTFDGVKTDRSTATMYGISVSEFLESTGMTTTDLGWIDSLGSKNHNLWNAKLHIRVPKTVSFASAYSWLNKLMVGEIVKEDPSFKVWLSFPRASLRELHGIVDAEMEWTFRLEQEAKVCRLMRANVVPHLQQLLCGRHNDSPCDLQWIVEMPDVREGKDLMMQILHALEDVAVAELANHNFDIVGRAFMVASALLSDFSDKLDSNSCHDRVENSGRADEIISFCSSLILRIRSLSLQQNPVDEAITYLVQIVDYRRSVFGVSSFENCTRAVSEVMERLSFCMNELSIGWGYTKFLHYADDGRAMLVRKTSPVLNKQWVESSSPVRVDLAGGWSDTPPICYEFGGAVTGMAVRVDSQKPLSCRCRLVHGQQGILLRSENRSSRDGSLVHAVEVDIGDIADLADFRNPMSDCALLKAALICMCLVSEEELSSKASLQSKINHFCSSGDDDVRLEIISTSNLPQGSGMGTSSILAATVLACICKCVGYGDLDEDYLLHGVLMLEQLLTSGGGWQDQAHGIIPGIKTVSSAPSKLPVALNVERIPLSKSLKGELDRRVILVFTGMTRLARNILQDVLRRWSRRTDEVVQTVARNVTLAHECRDALVAGDVDKVGTILTDYSTIKVQGMAGEGSGALPKSCQTFISSLLERKMIQGASLCGAGGGGFMVLILSKDQTMEQVADFVGTELVPTHPECSGFTFHSCHICDEGLTTVVIEEEVEVVPVQK